VNGWEKCLKKTQVFKDIMVATVIIIFLNQFKKTHRFSSGKRPFSLIVTDRIAEIKKRGKPTAEREERKKHNNQTRTMMIIKSSCHNEIFASEQKYVFDFWSNKHLASFRHICRVRTAISRCFGFLFFPDFFLSPAGSCRNDEPSLLR